MKSRQKILAANWKMNKTSEEIDAFFKQLLNDSSFELNENCEMWIAPSNLGLASCVEHSKHTGITIAAQNCHQKDSGAFTGEVSLSMLSDAGVTHVLLGHSERRQYFAEDNTSLIEKLRACDSKGVKYVFCVGEDLAARESESTFKALREQLSVLDEHVIADNLTIAYEPVWAIGTGKAATGAQAQEVHAFIRGELIQVFGEEKAQSIRVIYGGSVKESNIEEFINHKDIDGALVGGASLDPVSFNHLYKACCK